MVTGDGGPVSRTATAPRSAPTLAASSESPADRPVVRVGPPESAGAEEENFLWLIAAGGQLSAYIHAQKRFFPAELAAPGPAPL